VTHRQQGLVVIGVAVFLVVVVAGLRPHLVTGAAQAAPVPGPPVVGDCVLDPVPGPPMRALVTDASGGTVPVYPAQQIRPCTGTRYGEITAVIATPKPTVVKGRGTSDRYLDDPNQTSCAFAAAPYVGMTTQPIQGFWQTYLQITSGLSRPSARQQAAGQRWAACIVTLRPSDPGSATATAPAQAVAQYGSSLRDALHTGRQRDQLGTCIPAVDWDRGPVTDGCRQPHTLEILAFGDSGDHPVTRAQVELSCRQLVRDLTAMPDPTAAGALSIQIHVEDSSSTAITTPQVPAHSYLACGITTTGSRKLRGSLIALGRQPIPWA